MCDGDGSTNFVGSHGEIVMSKASENSPDTYSDEEAQRRADEALRRALNTPPQPKPSRKSSAGNGKPLTEDVAGTKTN